MAKIKSNQYRVTVGDLEDILDQYPKDLPIRFHTLFDHNMFLLSDYLDRDKKPRYLEIDIG